MATTQVISSTSNTESPSKTIYDSLVQAGYSLKRYTGDVGVEIETETLRPYDPPQMRFFSNHRDNSLRDFGVEYVTNGALSRGTELRLALAEWDQRVAKQYKLKPDSFSTSVHGHLNFLNNTWRQMVNFLVTYYLHENLLIRFSGPDRLSNLFCLPLCDAEGSLTVILEMIKSIQTLNYRKLGISPENSKYAALNVCNLVKLGTLESRSMRGVTDINIIHQWIDILLAIKDFAEVPGRTPLSILKLYEDKGPGGVALEVFGEKNLAAIDAVIDSVDTRNKLIEKNLWYASKIATASKFDDENWGFPKPKKIYKSKYTEQLDSWANEIFKKPFDQLEYAMKVVVEERLDRSLNVDRGGVVFVEGDQ